MQRELSWASWVNNKVLKSYTATFVIQIVFLTGQFLIELIYRCCEISAPEKHLVIYRTFINARVHGEYFTLFSIAISLLSVLMAALTIIFGSLKICGINSSSVIKNVFKYQFLLCRTMVFVSTFILFGLAVFDMKYTFFLLFLFLIINMIYLLHLCLSINLDKGVRYGIIPQYIFKERVGEVEENDSIISREFISNVNDENVVEFKKIFVCILRSFNKKEMVRFTHYKMIDELFQGVRKSMIRNYSMGEGFLHKYMEVCADVFNDICEKDKKNNLVSVVYLAVFRNIVDCVKIQGIEPDVYQYELEYFFSKTIGRKESEKESTYQLKCLLWGLIIVEITLYEQGNRVRYLSEYVYSAIGQLKIVISKLSIDKSNIDIFFNQEQLWMYKVFQNYEKGQQSSYDYFRVFNNLMEDIRTFWNRYGNPYTMMKYSLHIDYSSRVFLLYKMIKMRRDMNGE